MNFGCSSAPSATDSEHAAHASQELLDPSCAPFAASSPHHIVVPDEETLQDQLESAGPGTMIQLVSGRTYRGHFILFERNGTQEMPITICGNARIYGNGALEGDGDDNKLHGLYVLRSKHFVISGIEVAHAEVGVHLKGSSSGLLSNIKVHDIGGPGVHFGQSSSTNVIENSLIYDTGLEYPENGEGIYVGNAYENWPNCTSGPECYGGKLRDQSNCNRIVRNKIGPGVRSEAIDIKEGPIGTYVEQNYMIGGISEEVVLVRGAYNFFLENTIEGSREHGVHNFEASLPFVHDFCKSNGFSRNNIRLDHTGYGFRTVDCEGSMIPNDGRGKNQVVDISGDTATVKFSSPDPTSDVPEPFYWVPANTPGCLPVSWDSP
ncbi:MAG: right-handed parallel beta-helix repeat-containing protein [Myxococcota bacterium]